MTSKELMEFLDQYTDCWDIVMLRNEHDNPLTEAVPVKCAVWIDSTEVELTKIVLVPEGNA